VVKHKLLVDFLGKIVLGRPDCIDELIWDLTFTMRVIHKIINSKLIKL